MGWTHGQAGVPHAGACGNGVRNLPGMHLCSLCRLMCYSSILPNALVIDMNNEENTFFFLLHLSTNACLIHLEGCRKNSPTG